MLYFELSKEGLESFLEDNRTETEIFKPKFKIYILELFIKFPSICNKLNVNECR